ncbi:hypothetical protein JQ597_02930 [Bradyrhizobium sp. AUGA SZCCT0177]|uniref:hypothetical protein n=1 Tax=Bradyrhizobium sp. AUGA SZCCT0177 TaxID=2807665 RepID=UPI001BA9FB89|nr:hypothetical protein [Bradyrhizobium sp. AUGA SZCCT0177]MBR1280988.1 hypothetical protein [Bradyrhizobium sp. AUGA SZCCT0177]
MPSELTVAIEEAYRVFGAYRLGRDLVVCHCRCCMTEETERQLVNTPLRSIPADLLAEYTNSAHDYDDGQVARELRYFLPRYFELIAARDYPDHIGLDICLRRLGQADHRNKWPRAEVESIDRFFDAFLSDSLTRLDLEVWPAGYRLAFNIRSVVTLVVTAGGDIDRLLHNWVGAEDPAAAIHMAALREYVIEERDKTYLHSACLESHEEAAKTVGEWLLQPNLTARIEAAFFAVGDPRLQVILSNGMRTA